MSTRRSTRASSRASSVAGSDIGLVTPRRSARNIRNSSPLPAVAPRESTSYGSGIAVLPIDIRRRGHERDLTETLAGILGTVQENIQTQFGGASSIEQEEIAGRSRRATSDVSTTARGRGRGVDISAVSTPGTENTASFHGESGIFGDATFGEDPTASPHMLGKSREATSGGQTRTIPEVERVEPATLSTQIARLAAYLFGLAHRIIQSLSPKRVLFASFLLLAFLAGFFKSGPSSSFFGFDIDLKVQQWMPFQITRPLSFFNQRDVLDLQKRMYVVEKDLDLMRKDVVLNKEALEELKRDLPEEIYLYKSKGETQLPGNFWSALLQKSQRFALDKGKSETIIRSDWEDFVAQNEAKIKAWQVDSSEDLWAKHLQTALKDGGVLASREEVIQMIHKRWDNSQSLIKEEVKKELSRLIDTQKINGGIAASEAIALSKEVFREMYNGLQLKAFSQSQDSEQADYYHLRRPNHFSFGLGAVVNPSITSPTFNFAKQRAWLPKLLLLRLVGYGLPTPNPPAEALNKWDEAGECWCSPTKGNGAGVQLGVLLAHDLYPKEVVIEHIPKSATLDFRSAPKEMELLAKIEGFNGQGIVGRMSEVHFPDMDENNLDSDYIRIGTWVYDVNWPNHVQHFYPQVDLESLKISTRQLVVRAKNNWGDSDYTCLYRVRVHGEVADNDTA